MRELGQRALSESSEDPATAKAREEERRRAAAELASWTKQQKQSEVFLSARYAAGSARPVYAGLPAGRPRVQQQQPATPRAQLNLARPCSSRSVSVATLQCVTGGVGCRCAARAELCADARGRASSTQRAQGQVGEPLVAPMPM